MSERELTIDGETYVFAADGDDLRVGRRTGSDVDWYDATVPSSTLPGGLDDEVALRGVVTAIVERGG